MPADKAAGERCIQLDELNCCLSYGKSGRPDVWLDFMPSPAICGDSREQALLMLNNLDVVT